MSRGNLSFILIYCYVTIDVRQKEIEKVAEICWNKVAAPQITERNSTTMEHYSTKKRYCPKQIQTKKSVEIFGQTRDVDYVTRKYHISKGQGVDYGNEYACVMEWVGYGFVICAGVFHNHSGFAGQALHSPRNAAPIPSQARPHSTIVRNLKGFRHDISGRLHNCNHTLSLGNADTYCVHKTFLLC